MMPTSKHNTFGVMCNLCLLQVFLVWWTVHSLRICQSSQHMMENASRGQHFFFSSVSSSDSGWSSMDYSITIRGDG